MARDEHQQIIDEVIELASHSSLPDFTKSVALASSEVVEIRSDAWCRVAV
jgi:hypothetical protein